MTWFEVGVEMECGIRGVEYHETVFPSSAADACRNRGLKVLWVRCWNESQSRWPNIGKIHD